MKIFIVGGQCGEYSDHREWPIVAYTTRENADKHKMLAQLWAYENGDRAYDQELANPYDSEQFFHRDTEYYVMEIELRTEVPQVNP
jgi:hypothetical protein